MHGMACGDSDQVDEFLTPPSVPNLLGATVSPSSRGVVGESSVGGSRFFLSTESKLCFAPSRISAFSVSALHSHTYHTVSTVFQSFLAAQGLSCNTTLVLKCESCLHPGPGLFLY
jgi:hypothetical protein